MEVLSKYQYTINNVDCINDKGKKAVWWINTSNKDMILKKVSCSEATLKFIIAGTNYLIKKGCRLPAIIKNESMEDFTRYEDHLYVMSEGIIGNKLNDSNLLDRQLIVTELGRFHNSSIGFIPPRDTKPKNHLGIWMDEYNTYVESLNSIYQQKKNKLNLSLVDKTIIREFPYFYRRAKKSIEGLMGNEYKAWVIRVNKTGGLCHQDFSSANLLSTDKGIYVIDTDSLTIDLAARDIRKLLNKIMKKSKRWDSEAVNNFITWYNSSNHLTNDEWKVVMYDLMFPHLFLGAVHKYFFLRDETWNDEDYLNRINEMAAFEKTINPILSSYNVIGREF